MKAALAIYMWAIQHDCNLPYHVPVSKLLVHVTDASHPHTEASWLQRKFFQLDSIFDHENPQSLSAAAALPFTPCPHTVPFQAASFLAAPDALLLLFNSSGTLAIKTCGVNFSITLRSGGEWELRLNIRVGSNFSCWLDRTSQKCRSGKTSNSPDSWSINWASSKNRYFSLLFRPTKDWQRSSSIAICSSDKHLCLLMYWDREEQHGNCDLLWEIKRFWETKYWKAVINHLLVYFVTINGTRACVLLLVGFSVGWNGRLERGGTLAQLQCFSHAYVKLRLLSEKK